MDSTSPDNSMIANDHRDVEIDMLLQGHTHIWNNCFISVKSKCLKCAIELGIPDAIHAHGGPMTLNQLVQAVSVRPEKVRCLYRVMRVLVLSGFFKVAEVIGGESDEEAVYSLTDVSKLLLMGNSLSMEPYLRALLLHQITKEMDYMSAWFQNDDHSLIQTVHGVKSMWDLDAKYPEWGNIFNNAMAAESRIVTRVVVDRCKWAFQGLRSLVDVGGGTGEMGKVISVAFPDIECTVLDLPRVVTGLEGSKNLKYVEGNMFDKIPSADAILLKCVLHDWTDKESIKILKKCREAVPKEDGKLIVIDMVLNNPTTQDHKLKEAQLCYDVQIMSFMGSERSEREWAKLFEEAGFSRYKMSHVLGIRSLIEVYP